MGLVLVLSVKLLSVYEMAALTQKGPSRGSRTTDVAVKAKSCKSPCVKEGVSSYPSQSSSF